MEGGRKKSDTERKREEGKGDKNKERKKKVVEAGPKKDRLESDNKKRRMQEGQAGPSKEKIGKKEKERERLKKIWKKEMDRRKALKKQGEEEVKVKNEKHIAKKGHKRVELLKGMTKKEQREVGAWPKMKRKANEDEGEPEKKTKNTGEQKELGPTKNPAEEKDLRKFHLMKIKKQKEERRKQLKEAEYQKEMAKKQKKAVELPLKDLTKKEPKEAEFLKVQPKNEKIKGTEDEEDLKKTSKDTIEQKGLGLKTHLMRIKKEKEAMRKELKKEEFQNEMGKKQARGVELLKETTQKWQKQAELLKQMIREKDEAELQKEVLKKAHKEAGLREMIHQEKVTEVELRKTSKDTEEQKGLGLKTHLMRIKKEKEAMRKELKKEELQNEMEKKQARGVELLKETTQKWQKQAGLLKQMIREKDEAELQKEVLKKAQKETDLTKEVVTKAHKEEGLMKEVVTKAHKEAGLMKEVVTKAHKEAGLMKEVVTKAHKEAGLMKEVVTKAHKEAGLMKEVVTKAHKEVGLREMIHQEKVTEVELKKTSKDTKEQKGLGLGLKMRIKKEKEAMRKELKKEELHNEMDKKQARGVELLKESTQKWQKQAELLKQMIGQKTNVNTKAEKGAELKEMINKKSQKEPRIQKMIKKRKEGTDCLVSWTKNPDEDIKPVRPMKVMKKEGNQQQRWWEEERNEDGTKWRFLEHRGPLFPAEYQPFPDDVNFYYDGKVVKLNPRAEEVAFFYAQMLDQQCITSEVFRKNFLTDWRREMTPEERMLITDLNKCDFFKLFDLNKRRVDAQYNRSKEEKQAITEANKRLTEEYGYCTLNQHRERIENFRIEPPGLFCGRGDHPKEGMLKRRIQPEDVIINCSRQAQIPEPPAGHQWKEVRHDNTVTWLASWTENIQGASRYIKLNASSKPQGEKDWEKYELARRLNSYVDQIRSQYYQDMDSAEMVIRQRATALYFIDKLALSVGSEKKVSCSSLCVKNITLHKDRNGNEYMVEFDFLRKDLIRSYDKVPVTKRVYKNLENFIENKETGDKLFDLLTSSTLNEYISSLMPGLTGKVFRTYNASVALQKSLRELSCLSDGQAEKLLAYNRANPAAAVHCNHQQADTKNFEQSMAGLYAKIDSMTQELVQAKTKLTVAIWNAKGCPNSKWHVKVKKKRKATRQLEDQLLKLSIQAIGREEGRQISLSTFKSNYLDPRITIAWCMNMNVPLEKIYNKSQRVKFAWAIAITKADFEF